MSVIPETVYDLASSCIQSCVWCYPDEPSSFDMGEAVQEERTASLRKTQTQSTQDVSGAMPLLTAVRKHALTAPVSLSDVFRARPIASGMSSVIWSVPSEQCTVEWLSSWAGWQGGCVTEQGWGYITEMSKPEKRSKSEWVVKVMTHATWAPHIPHVLDLELKALPAANRPLATWQWSRRRMPDGMEMEEGELSMYAHVLVVLYPRVTGVQLTSSIRACGAPAPKGLSENDWCEWWCDHVLKTTLSDLRRLHELGYVHGDIKPDNMATKWTGEASHVCVHDIPLSNPDADVHLVDLDLATPFRGDAWNMERARAWSADDDVPRALWELYAPTYRPPELWVVPHTIGCSPFPGMDVYAWAMSMCLILARVSPSTAPRFMTAAADALNWKVPHAPRDPLTHATMNVCALLHPTHVKAYAQHVGELVEAEGEDYPDAQLPEQHTVQWLKKSRTTTWCPAAAFEEDLWSPHPLDMKGDERCKQLDDVWDMSVPDLYPGWFMRPRRVTVLRWMRWRAWYLEQCATHAEAHKLVDKQGWIASIMETMMQRTTGRTRRKMQAVWSILKRALAPNPALRWYNSQDVWEALEKHHVFTSS